MILNKVYNIDNEELIRKQISKLQPLNYNQFRWWRKFDQPQKSLSDKAPLLDKIKNGDLEFSHYYWQAKFTELAINEAFNEYNGDRQKLLEKNAMDLSRRKRLWDDFERDEKDKLTSLRKQFSKEFKMTEDDYENEILEFGGSLEELYYHCELIYGKKLRLLKQRGRPSKI
jgi:hypothetical protein